MSHVPCLQSTNTSAELSFLTAPAPGSNDLLQIIVTADMGYCEVGKFDYLWQDLTARTPLIASMGSSTLGPCHLCPSLLPRHAACAARAGRHSLLHKERLCRSLLSCHGRSRCSQFVTMLSFGATDSSLEWEASYPNPITTTPPGTLQALKTQVGTALKGVSYAAPGGGLAWTTLPSRQLHLSLSMHLTMQPVISPCQVCMPTWTLCQISGSQIWHSASFPICTSPSIVCAVQFNNAYNGNWLSFCAGRQVGQSAAAILYLLCMQELCGNRLQCCSLCFLWCTDMCGACTLVLTAGKWMLQVANAIINDQTNKSLFLLNGASLLP